MKTLNKAIKQLVINQGAVIDTEGQIVYLVGLTLSMNRNGKAEDGISYDLSEVKQFDVYISPEQVEIDRLNSIIASQQETIENMAVSQRAQTFKAPESKPLNNRGQVAKTVHLKADEVRGIEVLLEKVEKEGFVMSDQDIADMHQCSTQVIAKIRRGTHGKTSSQYTTYLMRKNNPVVVDVK